jgi:ATP-dependent Clp protease ATP-binding subunit ClpB
MQWQVSQQEFTEMAWQAIVSSPEVAKENKHQIVETEHLMKALLEQKNGLARRIFSKIGIDNTRLLEATDKHIQRQPKVIDQVKYALVLMIMQYLFSYTHILFRLPL